MGAALKIDIGRGIESGQGRTVHMGRVETLSEVFTSVTPRTYGDPIATLEQYAPYSPSDGPGAILQGYATVELKRPGGRHLAANVDVPAEVRRAIAENMIKPGCDTITFKIIEWANGEALVTAENSQIIGGIWLAMLTPAAVAELHEVFA